MCDFFYYGYDDVIINDMKNEINLLLDQNGINKVNQVINDITNIFGYQIKPEELTMLLLLRFSEWLEQLEQATVSNIVRVSDGHVNDKTFNLFLTTYRDQLPALINYCHLEILTQWKVLPVKSKIGDIIYIKNIYNSNVLMINTYFLEKNKGRIDITKLKEMNKIIGRYCCLQCKQYMNAELLCEFKDNSRGTYLLCLYCCAIEGLFFNFFRCLICSEKCKPDQRFCGSLNCKGKNSLDFLVVSFNNGVFDRYLNILALRDKTFDAYLNIPQINDYLVENRLLSKIVNKTYFDLSTDPGWYQLIKWLQTNNLAQEFLVYTEKLADVYFKDKMKKIQNKKLSDGKYKNYTFTEVCNLDIEYGKNIMKIFPYYKDDNDWRFFFIYCSLYDFYCLLSKQNNNHKCSGEFSIFELHDKKFKDTFQKQDEYTEITKFVAERLPFVKNFGDITFIELCRDITYEKVCEMMISKNYSDEFINYMKVFIDIHYPILINVEINPKTMKEDPSSWNYRCIQYYHNLKNKLYPPTIQSEIDPLLTDMN